MARKKISDEFRQNDDLVIQKPLEEVMHDSIMPYAEYVILERALPRVEDGLKPVQRRILYTMHELGLSPDKPHRKSARVVGDTLGKYHPHGDSSVYDAMVRMSQDFSMGVPLVDGHGNFGSMDGDSAAAMRYTEVRMTPLATEILRDIGKDTVDFSLNFDDTLKEPDVMPGRFPNLLVNGASGIAVGLATNIPPHNLGEVIDGVIYQMENPNIETRDLLNIIKGPDFPTGGTVIGQDEIVKAYESGRGRIVLRAKVDMEKGTAGKTLLVIKELPYQVNKALLLERILKLREERRGILNGILDIRDESDRNGIRAVIEVRRDGDPEKILNYLYKYSDLQVTFGINMVAIAGGKPQQLSLKEINSHYIEHQKEVVRRRTQFDLDRAKAREHIIEGLIIAIKNIDRVIKIIRESKNVAIARKNLRKEFSLSEIQAQAILDMRLSRLTSLEILNLEKEYADIRKLIKKLEKILSSEKTLLELIKSELLSLREAHDHSRRTFIIKDGSEAEIRTEDIIQVEECFLVLTKGQDIKRVSTRSFNRLNLDKEDLDMADSDTIEFALDAKTNHRILLMTEEGNCYSLDALDIPEVRWRDSGTQLVSLLNGFQRNERIVSMFSLEVFDEKTFFQFYTSFGQVKRSATKDYETRRSKIQACGLAKGDSVVKVELIEGEKDIILVSREGMSIRFRGDEVSTIGRTARGVRGMQLRDDDRVIYGGQIDGEGSLLLVTDRGVAKRTSIGEYQRQGRGGLGFRSLSFYKNRANGRYIIDALYLAKSVDLIFQQKDGSLTILNSSEIPLGPRDGRGSSVVLALMDNTVENMYKAFYD